jgi:hypothetical protein
LNTPVPLQLPLHDTFSDLVNRSVPRVLLSFVCALLFAGSLAACGSDDSKSSDGPRALLKQTFDTTFKKLDSARIDARLQLDPEGILALGGPVVLEVKGLLARPQGGKGLPVADLDATATIAGRRSALGIKSDGDRAVLLLDGRPYKLTGSAGRDRGSKKGHDTPGATGVDAGRWMKNPQDKGTERVGGSTGVDAAHISGDVDVANLLEDLGLGANERKSLAGAITSAKADVWSGQADKILRRLVVRVNFKFPPGSKPLVEGLEAGKLELSVLLTEVNANGPDPNVKVPRRAKDLSQIPAGKGLGGFLACLAGEGPKAADLAACAAKLGP